MFQQQQHQIRRNITTYPSIRIWTARDCKAIVVQHKTNNLMVRVILQKLGISLQQRPKQSPGNNINSISHIENEKNIIKWVLRKKPTSLYANWQIKKPHRQIYLQTKSYPQTTKGRRVPLHLLEKVELN